MDDELRPMLMAPRHTQPKGGSMVDLANPLAHAILRRERTWPTCRATALASSIHISALTHPCPGYCLSSFRRLAQSNAGLASARCWDMAPRHFKVNQGRPSFEQLGAGVFQ
ncbi:hypothetical protein D7Y52_03190 [Stenotrophomonas maltophilia]|nr:hypothetical protein [Stenotrophomonas maltophilia]MBA0295997.1 hypothetical protein [Stenotrophomonas maltophilia]MBA0347869.1 hypothetical protein [Stenotrophomonas maltophilia]MBA0443007.1 hypothetical protein [Stenotrophomonas maltophilia]HEP1206682.1 hypothetical protein [Stenotrophomonas maltophilia]